MIRPFITALYAVLATLMFVSIFELARWLSESSGLLVPVWCVLMCGGVVLVGDMWDVARDLME